MSAYVYVYVYVYVYMHVMRSLLRGPLSGGDIAGRGAADTILENVIIPPSLPIPTCPPPSHIEWVPAAQTTAGFVGPLGRRVFGFRAWPPGS